jgi:integrative and conjugative element protein (TIGR02256 family)
LGDGLILIEDDVLSSLQAFRQQGPTASEAGGILIGFRRGIHLHVTHATTPGPLDRRSRYEFQRLDPVHQQTAFELWERSRHTADYIGEWHTHPQVRPLPSCIDRREWGEITRAKPAPMILAILGQQDCWIGIGHSKRLVIATQMPSNSHLSVRRAQPPI